MSAKIGQMMLWFMNGTLGVLLIHLTANLPTCTKKSILQLSMVQFCAHMSKTFVFLAKNGARSSQSFSQFCLPLCELVTGINNPKKFNDPLHSQQPLMVTQQACSIFLDCHFQRSVWGERQQCGSCTGSQAKMRKINQQCPHRGNSFSWWAFAAVQNWNLGQLGQMSLK